MSTPPARLDATTIPPRIRHPTIFEAFDKLPAGGSFILVNDHDPKPLFYQFQAERTGQFTWEYQKEGPDVWEVLIGKTGGV
jgi:uncharacterized protein (DUF2249 family)